MLRINRPIPKPIYRILISCKCYLVGSGVPYVLEERDVQPKDFDVMVEPYDYMNACKFISEFKPEFNSFGGLKIKFSEAEVLDMWPMSLYDYIRKNSDFRALMFNPTCILSWKNDK